MKIIDVQPTSLVEWPGKISYVIFLAGCNFKCPACYVPHLVLPIIYNNVPGKEKKQVVSDILKREGFIDAVCVSGGEPLLPENEPDILSLFQEIKRNIPSIKIRVETNGTNPNFLEKLIRQELVDSVAMDIKNSREKYQLTSGCNPRIDSISESISLIQSFGKSGLDYEFRTTLVPGLHEKKDVMDIASWLKEYSPNKNKIKSYSLQQFRSDLPGEKTINPEFIHKDNFPYKDMQDIKKSLDELSYFDKVEIRAEEI